MNEVNVNVIPCPEMPIPHAAPETYRTPKSLDFQAILVLRVCGWGCGLLPSTHYPHNGSYSGIVVITIVIVAPARSHVTAEVIVGYFPSAALFTRRRLILPTSAAQLRLYGVKHSRPLLTSLTPQQARKTCSFH